MFFDNRNRNAAVNTTTVTAVIFFQQPRISWEIFIYEKVYFTYVEVPIVIMSSQLTIFLVIVQKRIYGSIYFSSFLYLHFFNTYY